MPVRIRLQRHGRKGRPIFSIVAADSRSPRDGRFIEKIGQYNPNTNPATIELDFDSALEWLQKGAQPSDTCRAILSYKGVLLKKHLLEGVKKGALTEEQVEERFDKWLEEKSQKIQDKSAAVAKSAEDKEKARVEAENAKSEARAEALKGAAAEQETEAAAEAAEGSAEEAAPTEEAAATEEAATEEAAPEAEAASEEAATEAAEEKEAEEVPSESADAAEEAPAEESTDEAAEADAPKEDEKASE
jgi:small subunit ribosomal protein S16